jgi:hypothetical protein
LNPEKCAFTTSFATITTHTRRSTCYWIADEKSGNTTFFCTIQTTIIIGID